MRKSHSFSGEHLEVKSDRESMKEISTIEFQDADSYEQSVAIIRRSPGKVALALSIRSGGDVEVILSDSDAEKLAQAIQTALQC
jgi:hypothetical protein